MDNTEAHIAIANLVDANENALDYNKEDIETVRDYIRDTIGDLADTKGIAYGQSRRIR